MCQSIENRLHIFASLLSESLSNGKSKNSTGEWLCVHFCNIKREIWMKKILFVWRLPCFSNVLSNRLGYSSFLFLRCCLFLPWSFLFNSSFFSLNITSDSICEQTKQKKYARWRKRRVCFLFILHSVEKGINTTTRAKKKTVKSRTKKSSKNVLSETE